jgi:hypothetical protein
LADGLAGSRLAQQLDVLVPDPGEHDLDLLPLQLPVDQREHVGTVEVDCRRGLEIEDDRVGVVSGDHGVHAVRKCSTSAKNSGPLMSAMTTASGTTAPG